MADPLDEEREKKKRAIFDRTGPRTQQRILKKMGHEKRDPYQKPRDPIDLREQKGKLMTSVLPPPFNAPPGRVGMEAANELIPFFKPRPEGRGR